MNARSHRPGEWPVPRTPLPPSPYEPDDEYLAERQKTNREEARRYFTVWRIRGYLTEEATDADVREAAKRWCDDINEVAEDIARGRA